jgi:hypothetical protein
MIRWTILEYRTLRELVNSATETLPEEKIKECDVKFARKREDRRVLQEGLGATKCPL